MLALGGLSRSLLLCLGLKVSLALAHPADVQARQSTQHAIQDCLLAAVNGDGSQVAFDNQPGYQAANVHPYNINWPVTPVAVTYPQTAEQVASIVQCAAQGGYKVQARSGGHSYGNYCYGGSNGAIVADLSSLTHFTLDPTTNHATVGPGLLLRDVDQVLHETGNRAIAHGLCPTVGFGGHATVGGIGPATRIWGLTTDHVVGAEVVLANGSIVHTSETQEPDLFFAIRGAAASFGIVTSFEVRTEPAPDAVMTYAYTYAAGDVSSRAELFKQWQEVMTDPELTRKFSCSCTILPSGVQLSGTFFGSEEEFAESGILQRIPAAGAASNGTSTTVVTDWLGTLANWANEEALEAIGGNVRLAFHEHSVPITASSNIPDSGVDALFEYLDTHGKDASKHTWFIRLDHQGGAAQDVAADATAFAHRDVLLWMEMYVVNTARQPVSEEGYEFLDGLRQILRDSVPGLGDKTYPGHVDPLLENAQEAYWGANLPRLERIKGQVDPEDVFHNPQGVRPVV
ncbi:hypothetical protein BJX62DRAFT_233820 [Aspergillus germanicus]